MKETYTDVRLVCTFNPNTQCKIWAIQSIIFNKKDEPISFDTTDSAYLKINTNSFEEKETNARQTLNLVYRLGTQAIRHETIYAIPSVSGTKTTWKFTTKKPFKED